MAFIYPFQFSGTRWRIIDGDVYVSYLGSNLSGNGSPKRPYKTIQHAINAASNGARVVIGTGTYAEAVNGQGKSCRLVADGTVLMNGTASSTAFINLGANGSLQDISIAGYQAAVNGTVKELLGCSICSPLVAFTGTLRQTILLNTSLAGSAPVRLINCTLVGVTTASATTITYLESCHVGNTTNLQLSTPTLTYFDYCNQEPGSVIQINGTSYNTPAAVKAAFPAFQQVGVGIDPNFNRPAVGDYTLDPASALKIAGRRKTAIGAFAEAVSRGTSQILSSGGSISAVTINSNNFFELPAGIYTGLVETPVIDLGSLRPVRTLRLYADQVFEETTLGIVSADTNLVLPGAITVEMRYADSPTAIAGATYQPMIWDKVVSHDHKFEGNGQLNVEVRTLSYITTRCIQLRITLRSAGDPVLLAQENYDLLLQEDERQIQV
jgi:hypothetical protein